MPDPSPMRGGKTHSEKSGQSAIEYLVSYGWALLVLSIVVGAIYYFIFLPSSLVPSQCSVASGLYCDDIALGSNSAAGKVVLLLTNTQAFPVQNPTVNVSINGHNTTANCLTRYAVSGGSIICIANTSPQSAAQLVTGAFHVSAQYCGLSNTPMTANSCSSVPMQVYTGTFAAHSSGLFNPTVNISLSASPNPGYAGTASRLTALVTILGYPIKGATVNFTSNSTNIPVGPAFMTTDAHGNATTYAHPSTTGKAKVTASYSNVSKSIILTFTTAPSCSGFSASQTTLYPGEGFQLTASWTGGISPFSASYAIGSGSSSCAYVFNHTVEGTTIGNAASPQAWSTSISSAGSYWACATIKDANSKSAPCASSVAISVTTTTSTTSTSTTTISTTTTVSTTTTTTTTTTTPTSTTTTTSTSTTSTTSTSTTSTSTTIPGCPGLNPAVTVSPNDFQLGSSATVSESWSASTSPYKVSMAVVSSGVNDGICSDDLGAAATGQGWFYQTTASSASASGTLTTGSSPNPTAAGNYYACANVTDANSCPGVLSSPVPITIYTTTSTSTTSTSTSTTSTTTTSTTTSTSTTSTTTIPVITASLSIISPYPTIDSGTAVTLGASWTCSGSCVLPYNLEYLDSTSNLGCSTFGLLNPPGPVSPATSPNSQSVTLTATSQTTYYFCDYVTDSGQAGAYSGKVSMLVNPAPQITGFSCSASQIDSGQTFTCTSQWSGGTSPYNVYFMSSPTSSCGVSSFQEGKDSLVSGSPASFTITNTTVSSQTTRYYCAVVGDSAGSTLTSSVASVMINATPSTSVSPTSYSTCVGGLVTITAGHSGGSPPYTVTLYGSSSTSSCSSIVSTGTEESQVTGVVGGDVVKFQGGAQSGTWYYCDLLSDKLGVTATSPTASAITGSGTCPTTTTTVGTSTSTTIPVGPVHGSCFIATTEVAMADGSYKQISDIRPGDIVLSYSTASHRLIPNTVQRVVNYTVTQEYMINNHTGTDQYEYFYVRNLTGGQGSWVSAPNLTVGDYILSPLNSSYIRVNSVQLVNETAVVYDIVGTVSNNFIADGYLSDKTCAYPISCSG